MISAERWLFGGPGPGFPACEHRALPTRHEWTLGQGPHSRETCRLCIKEYGERRAQEELIPLQKQITSLLKKMLDHDMCDDCRLCAAIRSGEAALARAAGDEK